MERAKYEIWVDTPIKKVSREELAQMTMFHGHKAVCYAEQEGKKMLINFLLNTEDRILENGTYLLRRAATEVVFAEVEEYKKMIIYDHFKGTDSYTDDAKGIPVYETTFPIAVLRYPSKIVEKVAEAIIKQETKTKEKAAELGRDFGGGT